MSSSPLRRLLPRTLSSRLVIVGALSLLTAQLISFVLAMQINRGALVTLSTAPAVVRIVEAIEDPDRGDAPADRRGDRVEIASSPPAPRGRTDPAIASRAAELLANAGITARHIRVRIDDGPLPPRRMERILGEDAERDRRPRERLHLSVQLQDGRWITSTSRLRTGGPSVERRLIAQTFLIYAAVLLPLLWIGRRLSAPLRELTRATRVYDPGAGDPPLAEHGPADIRDLTRAFNDLRQRIGTMLAEKDHMLGAIGHDLRTPLASLRVRVESVQDADEREQMVATIEEMRQMLDDILALARIGRERQPPQRLDLADLAEAVVDDFGTLGADVALDTADRAIVSVRAPALRRAIRNLVDNAVAYGDRARVDVHAREGQALLIVTDEGPGIDADRIADMLEPFTRIEASRSRDTGGAGLGLALVRAVMQAEGGQVVLANRTDRSGLIATLILPLSGE